MALYEVHEEVANLRFARLVLVTVVGDRLGPANVPDPNDERLEVVVRLIGSDVQGGQRDRDDRKAAHGNSEIVSRHERRAKLLHVQTLRRAVFLDCRWRWLNRGHG